MSALTINDSENGVINLSGEITFNTVNQALKVNIFQKKKDLTVNFAEIKHSDSSGLGLMVHWMRIAKRNNLELRFENVPDKLVALAKVSNLDSLLPIV